MKITFGKKLVLFLHWLLSLIASALAVVLCFWPETATAAFHTVDQLLAGYGDIAGFVLLAIYLLLAVWSVAVIFSGKNKRIDRNFITVDTSESGRTRIAVSAVDQMIRQSVRCVDGIVDMKSGIVNCEDAISINAAVTIVSGAHVPTVTMNIQRAIRSYIELNCGVAVREVSVSVNAMENADENGKHGRRKAFGAAPAAVAPAITPAEPEVAAEEAVPAEEVVIAEEIVENAEENREAEE